MDDVDGVDGMEDLVHAAFQESLKDFEDDVEIVYVYVEFELEINCFELVEHVDFQVS